MMKSKIACALALAAVTNLTAFTAFAADDPAAKFEPASETVSAAAYKLDKADAFENGNDKFSDSTITFTQALPDAQEQLLQLQTGEDGVAYYTLENGEVISISLTNNAKFTQGEDGSYTIRLAK